LAGFEVDSKTSMTTELCELENRKNFVTLGIPFAPLPFVLYAR
jgi:hypothetical protein